MNSQRLIKLTDSAPILVDECNLQNVASLMDSQNVGQAYESLLELCVERHSRGILIVWGRKTYPKSASLGVEEGGFLTDPDNLIATMQRLCRHLECQKSTIDKFVQSLPPESIDLKLEEAEQIADHECLVIDFDGSLRIDPKKLFFVKVDSNPNPTRISGTEWLKLTVTQREEFTIEDLGQALHDSNRHNYEKIKVVVLKEILTKRK
jgi:hypothetical protein